MRRGRQECLPHLHTCFLNCLTSHFAGVEIIDSRIKQLTVTIRELTMLPGVSPGTANPNRGFLRKAVNRETTESTMRRA